MPTYIGQELNGYRILEQIGRGGMALVFKAYQPSMDRVVAIKILPDIQAQDESARTRFHNEARIIASLEHPHIIPVHDFGEADDTAFLVMRYLQAGNLKNLLAAAPDGKLSLSDAARLLTHIAAALDHAHGQGIVHRDVKPSNVLIDSRGQAFLTDFGIARVLADTQHLTKTGAALGTPAYMSPEQAAGKDVDHRSDIYSLGIILFQMLTGTPPFEADTPYATIIAHLSQPMPLPSALNPDIPEAVEQVLLKALARDPEDRFTSAGAMADALQKAMQQAGIEDTDEEVSPALLQLSGSLAGSQPGEDLTIDDHELLQRLTRQRRRKKLRPWFVGVCAFAILTTAGILLQQKSAAADHAQATIDAMEQERLAPSQTALSLSQAPQDMDVLSPTPVIVDQTTSAPPGIPEYIEGTLLFETDFENGDFNGWNLIAAGEGTEEPDPLNEVWKIIKLQGDNHVLEGTSISDSEVAAEMLFPETNNLYLTYDILFLDDTSISFHLGLDERYINADHFDIEKNRVEFLHELRQEEYIEIRQSTSFSPSLNQWYSVSIEIMNGRIIYSIDDEILIDQTVENDFNYNSLYLTINNNTHIYLDNIVLTELKGMIYDDFTEAGEVDPQNWENANSFFTINESSLYYTLDPGMTADPSIRVLDSRDRFINFTEGPVRISVQSDIFIDSAVKSTQSKLLAAFHLRGPGTWFMVAGYQHAAHDPLNGSAWCSFDSGSGSVYSINTRNISYDEWHTFRISIEEDTGTDLLAIKAYLDDEIYCETVPETEWQTLAEESGLYSILLDVYWDDEWLDQTVIIGYDQVAVFAENIR